MVCTLCPRDAAHNAVRDAVHVWDFPTQALHPTSTLSTSSLQETSTSPLHQQVAGGETRGFHTVESTG